VCQIVALFFVHIMLLLNLSLIDRDKAFWSTLVGAGFGYLVPNPRFKRIGGSSGNNELIHYLAAQQQLDGPLHDNKMSHWKMKLSEFVELEEKVGSGTIGSVVSG